MNGFPINWLWVAGAIAAVWIVISAMGRRQTRLTGALKDHVKQHNDALEARRAKDEPKE